MNKYGCNDGVNANGVLTLGMNPVFLHRANGSDRQSTNFSPFLWEKFVLWLVKTNRDQFNCVIDYFEWFMYNLHCCNVIGGC